MKTNGWAQLERLGTYIQRRVDRVSALVGGLSQKQAETLYEHFIDEWPEGAPSKMSKKGALKLLKAAGVSLEEDCALA